MPIRAVFFDLDDTLLETYETHTTAVRTACERVADAYPEWSVEALLAASFRVHAALEAAMEAGQIQFVSHELFRQRVWTDLLQECGLPVDLGGELTRRYLEERRKNYRLYDDVLPMLECLHPQCRLVLITNGLSDLQREKVEAAGLSRWLHHVVVSGDLGHWKPRPEIFRRALDLAETTPEAAVMVGDSLPRDIAGAKALGLRTVWMRRYPHLEPISGIEPDAVLSDSSRLPELLAEWA